MELEQLEPFLMAVGNEAPPATLDIGVGPQRYSSTRSAAMSAWHSWKEPVSEISPPSRPYHHGDLRSALVEEALALERTQGPTGVSLREATRRVGVTPSAAYRHFQGRSHLLEAVARVIQERMVQRMRRRMNTRGTPIPRSGPCGACTGWVWATSPSPGRSPAGSRPRSSGARRRPTGWPCTAVPAIPPVREFLPVQVITPGRVLQ